MIANYHSHTWRCNHAEGTEEEYVLHAIRRGLKILGFSDHTPYPFPDGYVSRIRMKLDQLDDYIGTIGMLTRRYADQIEIHTGLECEYYPRLFSELHAILRDKPVEYLILGQHMIGGEPDGIYSGGPTSDPALLKQYCRQSMDAMQTGLFTYFAHPDIINFQGDRQTYRTHMSALCREAKQCGIPLEINLLGLESGRNYPNPLFLELAAEEGCPMILGIDAHSPDAFTNLQPEANARKLAAQYGCQLLDTVPLRSIK